MSQRRGGSSQQGGGLSSSSSSGSNGSTTKVEALSLEPEDPNNNNNKTMMNEETKALADRAAARVKHWKDSAFAMALTEPTWEAERHRQSNFWSEESKAQRRSRRLKRHLLPQEDPDVSVDPADREVHPDTTGCLCCSAYVCPLLGAGRVGNMPVLYSSTEWVEEVEEDLETGECTTRRYTRPQLWLVVGPYWPMLLFVTYPLILTVSTWAWYAAIYPGKHPWWVAAVWTCLTVGLIVALALTGCRDPGILYRHEAPPPQFEGSWRWNDATQTYRPRGAHFDTDTAVIVQGFDHTCPWTGTAIGNNNMLAFQFFVCLVFVCLIMDIFLITGAF